MPHSEFRIPHLILRPGRDDQPGGLIRDIRLEVRQQNFIDRLTVHTTNREGGPALHVAATVAGPDVDGLNLHVTGLRRELAFVPAGAGQTATLEVAVPDLPRWTPGQPCQPEPIDIRLLRHGEAVWETTCPVAVRDVEAPRLLAAAGVLRRLAHIPSEDELERFDAQGTPVILVVPPSWAGAVCGRLAHHPSIVAWAVAEEEARGASPSSDPEALAALSFGRPWVRDSSSIVADCHGPR